MRQENRQEKLFYMNIHNIYSDIYQLKVQIMSDLVYLTTSFTSAFYFNVLT